MYYCCNSCVRGGWLKTPQFGSFIFSISILAVLHTISNIIKLIRLADYSIGAMNTNSNLIRENHNNHSRWRSIVTVVAIATISTVSILSAMHMTIFKQDAYAWSAADAAYFQYGSGWGHNKADEDWNNGYEYGTSQANYPGECDSGDFNCLFLWGEWYGYDQEWQSLSS